jgi:HlyD family secretion protein
MMRRRLRFLPFMVALAACAPEAEPDAYGTVEAIEVTVSAEFGGKLTAFRPLEGDRLAAGEAVASIDAGQLILERERIEAERAAAESRVGEIARQIESLESQRAAALARRAVLVSERDIAERAYERTKRLYDQRASTAPELDRAERDFRTVVDQLAAHDQEIASRTQQVAAARVQQQTATRQVAAIDSQIALAGDRIRRAEVTNPQAGTVLAVYARAGEVVQAGQPLYKIADLATVDVRAYVAETGLARLTLGQAAEVTVDDGVGSRQTLPGKVTWIASEAQFTPTPIQTREERADLVYAVKIRVVNDAQVLKIGMPADVRFGSGAE